ncbi:uncharacterized protein LOC126766953 [Bactrocera neohumeralis]|uniref:uncharacterized protein LOC126766953 n=1 Tax=Bactrocera neohumeralis TaxID=98809 RepID=UPI0021667E90|nr:uncharacterized protein LOC126766953 [Bactrocera neohumeralis]
MHVVERVAGDFVPNNMIYHQLQKYSLYAKTGTAGEAVAGFAQLVRDAQALPPQSPADAAALAPTTGGNVSSEEKAKLDPLANREDALQKSAANATIDVWSVNDHSSGKDAVFTFYPFASSVAASIPYRSRHFCVMVNLKPIVPYHMMVVPLRCVGTVHALTSDEVEDWGRTLALTVRVLNEVQRRDAVALPYNKANSLDRQSRTCTHTLFPFDPNGKLAGEPENEEEEQQRRSPRTVATMKEETDYLRPLFKELESTL